MLLFFFNAIWFRIVESLTKLYLRVGLGRGLKLNGSTRESMVVGELAQYINCSID